ncbi:MAG: glycosyltransferase [Rikenellaceae bacterium]
MRMNEAVQPFKASVIISIYNNVETLRCVLDSLKMQSEQNFEIIISEDAEHQSVAEFCGSYPFVHSYQHLTQSDCGWQKNRALNRAIKAAQSDYLIFVDGDCVLHPRFVEFHLGLASERGVVAGKRVKLNSELSDLLMSDLSSYKEIEKRLLKMVAFGGKRGCGFVEEGIFIDPKSLFGFVPSLRKMQNLKGCNMSFSKRAIYDINGFDEDYTRPAIGEDIDLVWRFRTAGYRLVSARNLAVQYHIYHKENWSDQSENIEMMERKQATNSYFCKNGLDPQTI